MPSRELRGQIQETLPGSLPDDQSIGEQELWMIVE